MEFLATISACANSFMLSHLFRLGGKKHLPGEAKKKIELANEQFAKCKKLNK